MRQLLQLASVLLFVSAAHAQTLVFEEPLENSSAECWFTVGPSSYITTAPTPAQGTYAAKADYATDESTPFQCWLGLTATELTIAVKIRQNSTFDFPQGIKTIRLFHDVTFMQHTLTLFCEDNCTTSNGRYRVESYCEAADCGTLIDGNLIATGDGYNTKDQWDELVFYIKLNTPGVSDGAMQIIINGESAALAESISLRGTGTMPFNDGWVGGNLSNVGDDPATPTTRYFDDIRIWSGDNRDAFLGSGSTPIQGGAVAVINNSKKRGKKWK